MKLIFTRHGETNWNLVKKIQGQQDIELNEHGILQAKQLGENMKKENIEVEKIYTSKLKRAKVTAEIVGDLLNVPCIEIDGLEEMCLGIWEGLTWNEVKEQYSDQYKEWISNRRYHKTPNGESYQGLLERTILSLKEIISKEKGNVLIVSHSAVLMVLMCYLHNTPFEEMVEKYNIRNTETIVIDSDVILEKMNHN